MKLCSQLFILVLVTEEPPEQRKQKQLVWMLQPSEQKLVRQQNQLVEARYSLTPRELKLVLYTCAMVDVNAKDFGLCQIRVQDFAALAGLDSDHLYKELREIAQSVKSKPLVFENYPVEEADGKIKLRRIDTSWFIEVITDANRDGYFAVLLSSRLKPFLLQLKKDYTRFQLGYAIRMRSSYAIRLYQVLQRWAFKGQKKIILGELRLLLGTREIDKDGKIIRDLLPAYKNFKQRALLPAVAEVNQKSDLWVEFTESRLPGSKGVNAILFQIHRNTQSPEELADLPLPSLPKLPDATQTQLDSIAQEFGLSAKQVEAVADYVEKDGIEHVQEKAAVVRSQPRENLGRAFMAALKDDWQMPRSTVSKKVARKKAWPELLREETQEIDYSFELKLWLEASQEQRDAWFKEPEFVHIREPQDRKRPSNLVLLALRTVLQRKQKQAEA